VGRAQLGELVLELGLLERRFEALVDHRLALGGREPGHQLPLRAPLWQLILRVLHPHDGRALGASPVDGARHVLDDPLGVPGIRHHADLRIHDEQHSLVALPHRCQDGLLSNSTANDPEV